MQDGVWSNERVAATCHDVLQYRDAGSSCDAPSLLDDPQPLRTSVDRFSPEISGFGNRIGWWLSISALAEATNRSVYTTWAGPPKAFTDPGVKLGAKEYLFQDLVASVTLPLRLRFISKAAHSALSKASRTIPTPPVLLRNYYYVPKLFWFSWGVWAARGDTRHNLPRLSRCGVSEEAFARAYAHVQAQFQPRVSFRRPTPHSYLVLHVRRRSGRIADFPLLESTIALVRAISHKTSLPWMTISANTTEASVVREALKEMNVATLEQEPPPPDASHTWSVLRDFFTFSSSSGVLIDINYGSLSAYAGWVDSSLSTSAAQHGGAPLLIPHPSTRACTVTRWVQCANRGRRLDGIFMSDQNASFLRAVAAISARRSIPRSS